MPAQNAHGFDDFEARIAVMLDQSVSAFQNVGVLRVDWFPTALGPMIAVSSVHALHLLEYPERKALPSELKRLWDMAKGQMAFGRYAPTDQIEAELSGYQDDPSISFKTQIAPQGTPFQNQVWTALRRIPAGQTKSYGAFATDMNRPEATRAIARANGANPIAIVIPCHRLIAADGALTGYGGGLWRKKALLEHELSTPVFTQRR